jgi:predicted phosphohydrolase
MDIFKGWQDYTARLTQNWRAVVTDQDTVVVAGDISWAMRLRDCEKDFAFIQNLPGRKLLIKGNHDYWWETKKKMDAFLQSSGFDTIHILHNNAYAAGEAAVCGTRGWFFDAEKDADKKIVLREAGRLKASIEQAKKLEKEPVVFLHYPPVSDTQICRELYDVLLAMQIRECYYGHLHGGAVRRAFLGERDGIRFSLISGDYLEFCPKLIRKF